MKVFISWSGPKSKAAAKALHKWFRQVIQAIDPFVSDDDIGPGTQWFQRISAELVDTKIGIVCVTRQSMTAPWLLFEAGALSNHVGNDTGRVVPLLIDLEPADLAPVPLSQFQAVLQVSKESIANLTRTINDQQASPLAADILDDAIEKHWPELEAKFESINNANGDETPSPRPDRELLDEILTLVRSMSQRPDPSTAAELLNSFSRRLQEDALDSGQTIRMAGERRPNDLVLMRKQTEQILQRIISPFKEELLPYLDIVEVNDSRLYTFVCEPLPPPELAASLSARAAELRRNVRFRGPGATVPDVPIISAVQLLS